MNLDLKSLPTILNSVFKKLRRYTVFIFIIIILGLYVFLVYQIGQFSRVEADEDAVAEQLKTTPRLRIDQESIDKITQLQDQNISVQSLFKEARDNPFQD